MFDTANKTNVVAELKNQFPNEGSDWYELAADQVLAEQAKEGDSVANIINKLFR